MGYQSLVNEFNLTQAKVAEQVGKSRAHVANLLRLLQLDDELKSLLTSQKLSLGHAKVLLGLEDTQQRNALGKKVVEQGLTVRQCEQQLMQFATQFNLQKGILYPQKHNSLSMQRSLKVP